jgi:hypothetical protein
MEIAFDPDPIPGGATPGSSDKLAQRNLSIVESDNPGGPGSHTIPSTFEVRRTETPLPAGFLPDELLFDWTGLPSSCEATLYMPGASANHIVELADELYVTHRLQALDDQTIRVPAAGLTYVPVPEGVGANLPGLLTVELPPTVRKGQAFKVVVRQVTNAAQRKLPPPPDIGVGRNGGGGDRKDDLVRWRRILGSYEVAIPVRTHTTILPTVERELSVLRFIQESIPSTDRWFPVFNRYVDQVAGRVKGMGGNPDQIKPSPRGDGKPDQDKAGPVVIGKVLEVIFDGFGDFEGFVVAAGEERRTFRTREPGIAKVALRAGKDRWLVIVHLDEDADSIRKIVLRR